MKGIFCRLLISCIFIDPFTIFRVNVVDIRYKISIIISFDIKTQFVFIDGLIWYHIIDDSDKAFDKESDEIYVKDGYLNYSLILNNIPDDFTGTITYYAFATINDVNYQTEAITIKLVNGAESK